MGAGAWVSQERSWLLLAGLIDYAEVVLVLIGVVTIDFDHFRNKASAWSQFELHDNVERISDVGLDGPIGQVNSALEDATDHDPSTDLSSRRCSAYPMRKRANGCDIDVGMLAQAAISQPDSMRSEAANTNSSVSVKNDTRLKCVP